MKPLFILSPGSYVVPGIKWINTNVHFLFAAISGGVEAVLTAVHSILTMFPVGVIIVVAALLAWALSNWRVSLLALGALGFCWAMGLWEESTETIALVFVSVVISVAIAFPLGIWASRKQKSRAGDPTGPRYHADRPAVGLFDSSGDHFQPRSYSRYDRDSNLWRATNAAVHNSCVESST
jgi:hypothetical protein